MTFVVTTRMKLEGPTLADLAAVKREMQSGLGGVKASVRVGVDKSNVRQLAELRKELRLVRDGSKLAGQEVENFGRRVGIAGKRYLAFSVATVGVVKALGALRSGVSDAIDFEKAIIKIGQVSDRTIKQVDGLRSDILGVSASFGVSSSEIAEAAVTLAQTGRPLAQVRKDIEAIAKANLSPTFGNAKDTVEGLIAVQNQFEKSGLSTIEILSKLNTVAGKFPVESSDLITAVKKTGGAFQAAGGDLDELLALFTAVRSTTRESADTIGTAFRTITGRLGRIKTINFFKDIIDVDLVKDGKILAPLQAIEAIASKIKKLGIDSKSPLFSSIVEELGGIRQRAKVIPLLLQIDKAQKVLNTSRNSGNSITKDAEKAQEGLGTQITKVRQEFQKFVDNVLKDPAFRTFATELLNITKGLIGVADAARPLIPLVTLLGGALAFKAVIPLARGISPKIGGLSKGGTPGKTFSGSGIVPGIGITDSVPVMMKPQEFVMTTQAHRKYGTDTMKAINEGRLPANFIGDVPKFSRGGGPRRFVAGLSIRSKKEQSDTFSVPSSSFMSGPFFNKNRLPDIVKTIEAEAKKLGVVFSGLSDDFLSEDISRGPTTGKREALVQAKDFELGGKGKKFASQIAGTVQNTVANQFLPIVKKEVEAEANKRGLTGDKRRQFVSEGTSLPAVFGAAVTRQEESVQRGLLSSTMASVRGPLATNANLKGKTGRSVGETREAMEKVRGEFPGAVPSSVFPKPRFRKKTLGRTLEEDVREKKRVRREEEKDLARRQFPYKSKEELDSTRSTIRAEGIESVLNKPLTKEEKVKVRSIKAQRTRMIKEEQERDEERRRQGLKSAGFGDNSDLGSISGPPSPVSLIRGKRSKEPSRFSKIRNKLTLSGSSRGGGVGGVGGGGLNKSALFGIGGVGAAAALSGGLLESEEGQKLAKTLGGVAVGFGVLNEALKQSKPLLETRQKLEKAQNDSNAAKGFLEVAGSEERSEKRKLKDLELAATKNKDLSTGLSATKAAAEERVRKAETDEKKARENLKKLPNKASAKNVAIAEQELRLKREITKEAKKAVTENQKLLTTSDKRNAELTEEIALQQKATEKATGRREGGEKGVTRMNKRLLVAEEANRKQERRNQIALFASVAGTAAGTFFSDSGTEKLEKGDRSGIGSAVLGGTLQLGGTGVGIGALLGKGGGIAGGLIGAFAGFATAASKAEQALNNFRAETIKAFGSLGTLEFNKAGDEDNAKTEKSREAITDITKALRGEAGSLTQKKNRVGIVGRFGAGIGNFLERTVDSTFGDGGIRSTTRKSTKAALLADRNTIPGTGFLDGFNQFKVAEQIELRRNIRNQEKAIESKTQGGKALDILLRQADETKLTAVEFSQEFNGIITETAKLLNPRTFTEGTDADQKVAIDFVKEKLEEKLRQAKKTRAETLSATQNISNVIFSSFDNLNNSLATINERLSNTAVARANLDFIGSGSIGQSRGLGSDIANVVDINRSDEGGGLRRGPVREPGLHTHVTPRSRLNERAEAIGGSFGAEGQLISERFVNRSNAVEAIKELDRLIGGSTENIDADRFNVFKAQSLDRFDIKDPNTRKLIDSALEDIEKKLDEGIDPRNHPIGTTLDAINKKFAPIDKAMGRLAEIFNDQTNFLRSGLAQRRAISSKTIQEELKKNNISQQSSDLLAGLLGKEKKILAEQKNREILTGGLSAAELGKNQRKAKGNILELIAERETGRDKKGKVIDADRVAKIEVILDKEITARDRATEGLRYLTDVARSSAAAILAFQKAETDRLAKKSILERKLTGTPQEVRAINRKEALLGGFNQNPAVVQNITTRTFAEILSFAKEFGDAIVPQTGKSGKDTVDELLLARVKGRNLGFGTDLRPGEINRRDSLKGLANERTVRNPVSSRQEDSNEDILRARRERENIFTTGLDRVTREIITGATNEAGLEAGIGTARTEALNAQTEILKTLKTDFNEFGKSLADGFNSVFDFNFVPKKTPSAPPEFHTGGVAVTKGGKIGTGRSSKDNRLGITSKGPIKVGDGEAILNLDQQAKLSSLTGMGVSTLFSLIGLPGFAGGGVPSKKELEAFRNKHRYDEDFKEQLEKFLGRKVKASKRDLQLFSPEDFVQQVGAPVSTEQISTEQISNDQFFEEMFGDKANPGSPLALLQLDSRLSKQKINRPSGPLGPNGQRPSVPDSPTGIAGGTVRLGALSHRGTQSLSRIKKKTPTGGLSLSMTGELQNRIPVNTDPRPGSIPGTTFDGFGSGPGAVVNSPKMPVGDSFDGASPSGLNKSGRDPSSFAVPEANTPSLSDARHQQLENLGERSPDFQKKLDSAPGWVEELHDIRDDLGKVAADQQFKHISPSGRVETQRKISAGNTESLNNRGPVRTTPKDIDQIIEEGRVSRMVDPLAKGPTQLPKAPESIGNVVSQKSGPKIKASDEIERLRKEKAASPEKVSPVKTAIDNFVKALKPDPLKDFNKSLKDSGETQKKLNGLKNKQYDQKYDDLTVGIQEANDKGDTKKAAALSKKRQTMVQKKEAEQSREADKKFAQGMTEAMPQLGSGDGRLKALTQDAAGTNMLKAIVKNEREMADSNTKARQGRIGPAEINEEEKDSLLKKNAEERAALEEMKKNSSDVHQRNEKARLDREEKAIKANKAPLSMIQERAKARVRAERGHTDSSFPVTNMAPHNSREAPAGWGGQRGGVSGIVTQRRGVSGIVNHRRGVVDELAGGIPEGHDRLMANRAARKEEEDRLWANRGRRSSKDTKPAARKMAPLSMSKPGESVDERRARNRKNRESFFGVGPAIGGPPRTETPEQRKARLNKSRSDFFGTGPAITPDPDETPEMAEKRRAKSKADFYGVGPATQGKKIITQEERDAAKRRVEKALLDSGVSAEEARIPDIANVINENNSSTFIADRKILESSETEEERKKRRRSAQEDFYGAGPAIEGPGGLPSSKNNPGRLKKIQAAREAREKKLLLRSMPAGTRRAEKEERIRQARELRLVQEEERADNIERIKQGEIERGSLSDMSMHPDEQPGQVTQAAQPQTQFNRSDPFRGVWGSPGAQGSQGPQGPLGVAGAPQAAQVTQAAQPQAQSSFPDTISFDGTMNLNVNVAGLGDLEGRFSDVARMVVNNALNEFADQNQMSRPQQLANSNAAPGSAGSEATS